MSFVASQNHPNIKLKLTRNLTRLLKRGHPWVFADALARRPSAPPGTHAVLLDKKDGRELAKGFYHPRSPLAFRVCSLNPAEALDDSWALRVITRAVDLRRLLFDDQTTGYRLFNGEGDGLPGLICDVYANTAVLQLDGPAPTAFWHVEGLAKWLADRLKLQSVYLKTQSRQSSQDRLLVGQPLADEVQFLENGVKFTVDVRRGQKTGFFLDQRDNRQRIKNLAAGGRVLNLFGYTGGFSVYAGLGGANQVTTVDLAGPALAVAKHHWQLNNLPAGPHETFQADAFEFLETARQHNQEWALVVVDPPSFAPSKEAVKKATAAYKKLIAAAAAVTTADGFLAAASCSSHIDEAAFLAICQEAISKARRRATLLTVAGQPADHPSPLPFSEFRYLKFVLMRVE